MQVFDWLLKSNFFNFLILAFLIYWLLVKLRLGVAIENATKSVANKISNSDNEKEESKIVLKNAQDEEQTLPLQLEKIKEDANNTIETFKISNQKEIEETEKKLALNAQKSIEQEREKISQELQNELAANALEKAYDKTLNVLENDNELHRKFISDAINKIEELKI